jgi:hypothetical protein
MSQLSDTARLILEIYGESNLRKNQGFKLMDLILNKTLLNTYHQVKFGMAVNELLELGYLEWSQESALILTEKGYKALNN